MAKITAPVEGFTGSVVGVTFADGQGETKDDSQISYFLRHGYKVTGVKAAPTAEEKAETERVAAEAKAKEADAAEKAAEAASAKADAERIAAEKAEVDKAAPKK